MVSTKSNLRYLFKFFLIYTLFNYTKIINNILNMKLISSEECQALRLQFGRYKIPVVKKQKSFRIRSASKLKNSSNNESEEKK